MAGLLATVDMAALLSGVSRLSAICAARRGLEVPGVRTGERSVDAVLRLLAAQGAAHYN